MITELGAGYQYMGIATPATNPGIPDANVFYLASKAGTYADFDDIVINEGEVCALAWNGTWTKQVTGAATADKLNQLGQKIDAAEYEKQDAAESGNAFLGGSVGSTISKTSNVSYKWQKVYGNPGDVFFLDLYRRKESDWWVYYVDANDIIVAKDLSSSSTNYGWVEKYRAVIPEGASAMYFQSYGASSAHPLNTSAYYTGVSLQEEIDNLQEQVNELNGEISGVADLPIIPGEEKGYISRSSAYIQTPIGSAISQVQNTSYRNQKYSVTPGDKYFISIYRRREAFWWVYFTDADEVVISRQVKSSTTDYGDLTDYEIIVPDGAVYMYVQSYLVTDHLIFNVINAISIKTKFEDIDAKLNDGETIPDFVLSEGRTTHKRLLKWASGAVVSTIGQITDVHAGSSEKYKCVGYLDGLKDLFGFSALVNAGDIGLDVGETEDAAYTLIENTKRGMSANTLWIFCKGNHDFGTARIANGIIDDAFNAPYGRRFQDRIVHVRTSSTYGYGYTDDKFAKVRYIYLNTSEGNTGAYIMTSAQVSWLISVLNDTPVGYAIVVLTHLCIDAIGRWASWPTDADANCFVALRSIFRDFITRSSGTSSAIGVSWDFSTAQASLACVLSGDSHFDNYIKRDGVNYIVRQGYGNIPSSEMPQGAVYTSFDWKTQCLFDVLAINTDGLTGKVFRIGAGGADCDLEFTFNP